MGDWMFLLPVLARCKLTDMNGGETLIALGWCKAFKLTIAAN